MVLRAGGDSPTPGSTGDELVLTPKKCATLCNLFFEVIDDSSPSVLDVVGTRMVASVALTADRAILERCRRQATDRRF